MAKQMSHTQTVEVYQLHVRLLAISPMIWRRVLVRSDSTISDLHRVMQCVMGWDDERLHYFEIRGVQYGAERIEGLSFIDDGDEVLLHDFNFRDRERFLYEYNLIDRWQHEIRFEKRIPIDDTKVYPVCIGGFGKTPSEECAGADHFQALRQHYNTHHVIRWMYELLSPFVKDENHQIDYQALREANYWFTIDQFDRDKANLRLANNKTA